MAEIQVIGTVNIGQQGHIVNQQANNYHFPATGSMGDVEQTQSVQNTTSAAARFSYFTPKVFELNMVQPLEDALGAACNSSATDLKRCLEYLKEQELINISFIKSTQLCDHLNQVFGSNISYESFRHK